MQKFRVAIIGCGGMANVHSKFIKKNPNMILKAFADLDLEKAKTLFRKYRGAYYTTDVDEVMRDPEIDVVFILTWHDSHVPLAVKAAEAGKDIFVEKPMALTMEGCEEIERAVGRGGVRLWVGFVWRFCPLLDVLRNVLDKPLVTLGQKMDKRWPESSWSQSSVTGGGNVISDGCHIFDLVSYMNEPNRPTSIYASGGTLTHNKQEVVDTVVASVKFENGSVGSIVASDAGLSSYTSKFFIQVFDGSRAASLYDRFKELMLTNIPSEIDMSQYYSRFPCSTKVLGAGHLRCEESDIIRYQMQIDAFQNYLVEGGKSPCGVEAGTRATTMIVKAFGSIRTGKPKEITLP